MTRSITSLLLEKTRENAIVEHVDYQIPVTQPKGVERDGDMVGPKRIGDMQAAKRY